MDFERNEDAEREPLEVFPLEVWEKILGQLHPTDLTSCYNATRLWRELLHPERMIFHTELMAKVFLLIDNAVHFSGEELLNFRLVSRSWKTAIDHFLQHHPHHLNIGFGKSRTLPDPFLPTQKFTSSTIRRLEGFLESTDAFPNSDPFFSRAVCYHEDERRRGIYGQTRPRELFRFILARFGDRIWHAKFTFNDRNRKEAANRIYMEVQSFLRLMPNLRSLSIGIDTGYFDPVKMTPELEELLKAHPLPPLDHLMLLKVENIPNPLETGLLFSYQQVERLSSSHGLLPMEKLDLSRLKQLRIFPDYYYSKQKLQELHAKSSWPLTHLNLSCSFISDVDLLFRAINFHSNTLKHLMLEFLEVESRHFQRATGKLELPHLETIKIIAEQIYLNRIDFLVPCNALKNLEIKIWLPGSYNADNDDKPQAIQLSRFVKSMYASNVWDVLSNLNKIRIATVASLPPPHGPEVPVRQVFIYTRAELEVLQ